jgi:hypothetical protein
VFVTLPIFVLHKDKFGPLERRLREYETNEAELPFADKAKYTQCYN